MESFEHRTIAKVSKRLIPFLIVCYFIAYLDRVNVGFAALTMNQDLGHFPPRSASGPGSSSSRTSSSRSHPTCSSNGSARESGSPASC